MTNGAESIQHDGTATVIHVFVFQIFLLESGVSSSNRTVQWKLISVFFKTRTNKTNSPKSNGITKIKSYLDLGLLFVTHSLPWDQNLLLQ